MGGSTVISYHITSHQTIYGLSGKQLRISMSVHFLGAWDGIRVRVMGMEFFFLHCLSGGHNSSLWNLELDMDLE
jgi:hypothetical protein